LWCEAVVTVAEKGAGERSARPGEARHTIVAGVTEADVGLSELVLARQGDHLADDLPRYCANILANMDVRCAGKGDGREHPLFSMPINGVMRLRVSWSWFLLHLP
jgi:hypothetical protein